MLFALLLCCWRRAKPYPYTSCNSHQPPAVVSHASALLGGWRVISLKISVQFVVQKFTKAAL